MTETLNHDHKKRIINALLEQVMQEQSGLYYAPTTEIARAIHDRIQLTINRMPIEDQVLLKRLTVRDIEIMLSLHS